MKTALFLQNAQTVRWVKYQNKRNNIIVISEKTFKIDLFSVTVICRNYQKTVLFERRNILQN
jgi:hypothetical protein